MYPYIPTESDRAIRLVSAPVHCDGPQKEWGIQHWVYELFAGYVEACSTGWGVALDWCGRCSVEVGEQRGIVRTIEVGAEILAWGTGEEIAIQQAGDGIWAILSGGAIANLAGDASVLADCTPDTEVEGIDQLAVLLDLLAFEADVGDPALAA
jgi:hypothetical protein